MLYWQLVNRQTLQGTSTGGWKLLVPEAQVLDASAPDRLSEAAEGDPYVLRIRQLQLAKPSAGRPSPGLLPFPWVI